MFVIDGTTCWTLVLHYTSLSGSIKQRAIILQRGLSDRSEAVSKECLKLMKDQWLANYCGGKPAKLLKYLDVETYEIVGESVMEALLKDGSIKPSDCESIREFISYDTDENEGRLTSLANLNHFICSISSFYPFF